LSFLVFGVFGVLGVFGVFGVLGGAGRRRIACTAGGQLRGRGELRLQRGELAVHVGRPRGFFEFFLDLSRVAAQVLEDAGLQQFLRGAGPGLHGGDLLLRAQQRVARAAVIARLGDGVVGLHDFLLIAEVADLLLQLGEALLKFLFLLGQFLVLRFHPVDLLLCGGLAGQRLPGQVFPALPERGLGLVPQVGDGLP